MHQTAQPWAVTAFALCLTIAFPTQTLADADLQVADGLVVAIEYTLTLDDKSVADTNVGGEPLSYVQGSRQILPTLENGLMGMLEGQTTTIKVKAADAYGVYNDKAVISVEKEQIPPDAQVGSILSTSEGQPVRVLELSKDQAMLDFNHPMAGQDLTFEVKILVVERPE